MAFVKRPLLWWAQFAFKPAYCPFGLHRVRSVAVKTLDSAATLASRREG
jgi:hypothetical protein